MKRCGLSETDRLALQVRGGISKDLIIHTVTRKTNRRKII